MPDEGLKIKIGADATGVQETFTKVATSVKQTTESLGKVQRSGADAGYALMNLSRIAQDAPYGFIGIANNLNPMLESFQRLQKETGSTSSALSAMVAGLTGPAGIGLALGVVSSLLVAFGGKLFSSGDSAESASKKLDIYRQSLEDLGKVTERLNKSLGTVKDVTVAKFEASGNSIAAYVAEQKSLVDQRRNLQELLVKYQREKDAAEFNVKYKGLDKDALKEVADKILDTETKIAENKAKYQINVYNLAKTTREKREQEENEAQRKQEAANKKAEAEEKRHQAELKKLAEQAAKLRNDIQGPVSGGGTDPIKDFLKDQNKFANLTQLQGNGPRINLTDEQIEADKAKEFKKQYGELATTLTNTLTPAFESLFDAINNGQNAFEALGKALIRSVEQMIAQLLAMAAVAEIISLIFPGAGGFNFVFGQVSGIKIPKHAAGGITNGPQIGMIGEAGREAIIPLDRLPQLIGQMGGGNVTLQPSIHYDATGFRIMLNKVDKSINRRF